MTSGSVPARPDTVEPNTTESVPVMRPRTSAHAAWTTAPRVTPRVRAAAVSARVASSGRVVETSRCPVDGVATVGRCSAIDVGPFTPDSAAVQAARASAMSPR
ncbi:hypothetical protein GCM10007298_07020 [Williamsia phyllosphaerae]|uniref:Uncharacterized protein n=1 Tax=Williamsia phyllosphaerae TaxID=885042 RepID=A0ABQ1UB68_9NOCA|nr:hypothetical protein GCM10007298_07020 [Williamsia phyllosphaerae]